jgi:hypothetical protein
VSVIALLIWKMLTVSKEHEREGSFTVAEHEATGVVLELWIGTSLSFSMSEYRSPTYHLAGLLVLDEPPILVFTHRSVVEDSTVTGYRGIIAKLSQSDEELKVWSVRCIRF